MNEKQLAEEALARACEHLGLSRSLITLKLPPRLHVLGEAVMTGPTSVIRVKRGQTVPQLRNTVAHEARHIWHRAKGILTRDFRTSLLVWSGTEFVPLRQTYRHKPYCLEPDETDCRAYGRWFTRTFYQQDSYYAEVRTEQVRDLFLD